ncbi:MAG: c-type cytochrome [Ramlibacter sp.]
MKTISLTLAVLAVAALSGPAFANLKLAQEKQCLQCHAPDRDGIGPSFATIGAIYRRMKNPEAKLIAVMRDGSDANLGPHWGRARMPNDSERPRIDDREAKLLARWILRAQPAN